MHKDSFKRLTCRLSAQIEIQSGVHTVSECGQESFEWRPWRRVWACLKSAETPVSAGLSWKPTAYRVVVRGDPEFPRFFRVVWKNTLFTPTSSLKISPRASWIHFSIVETREDGR